jgi:hypothetical protein
MSYIIPPRLKRCNAVDKIIIKKFIKFFTVGAKRNDEYRGFSDIQKCSSNGPFVVHMTIFHYHKNCVHNTMVNFVRNPTEKPDILCIEEMPNVDFQGKRLETREISNKIFGIENMWEGI